MLERVYGIELLIPAANSTVSLEEMLAEVAAIAPPLDQHDELVFFASPHPVPAIGVLLERRGIATERSELLMLTPETLRDIAKSPIFADYAIEARSGNVYFDLSLTAAFALKATKPEAETAPALLQLEEHLIGTLSGPNGQLHLIDRQLTSLADRVARAYGCLTVWEA
ncbi:hypothetical protein [Cohnella yongneupensis]|uniref:Uncharacterized protein n=1 Tax=Cohnella yongneupensis TaxID=425006 RepID=A0ABW0R760_9BACL